MRASPLVRRAQHLVVAVAIVAAATGCSDRGMLFSQDRRVRIVAPEQNGKVTLPFTVRWSLADGVEVGRDIASFAVFFDVEPQPPDEGVDYFSKRDTTCARTPGCPDARYFIQRGIYTTKQTRLTLDDLLPAPGVDIDRGDDDRHDVTIVALDGDGRRLNEASWSRTFVIERPPAP